MLDGVVTVPLRVINRVGGRHGEFFASALLAHLPTSSAPHTGHRAATRRGLSWHLDLADNLQHRLYWVGSYEALTLRALTAAIRPGDTMLDVGANIGAIALPVARHFRGTVKVFAVEAAQANAARLRQHVASNRLVDQVQVIEVALSSHEGVAHLHQGGYGAGDVGTLTLEGDGETVGPEVRMTTVDALSTELDSGEPEFGGFEVVKIDVEGHELAVLDGMIETFARRPPRVMLLELVPQTQQRAGHTSAELLDRLRDLGYHGWAIRHRGIRPVTQDFAGNVLFLRDQS